MQVADAIVPSAHRAPDLKPTPGLEHDQVSSSALDHPLEVAGRRDSSSAALAGLVHLRKHSKVSLPSMSWYTSFQRHSGEEGNTYTFTMLSSPQETNMHGSAGFQDTALQRG